MRILRYGHDGEDVEAWQLFLRGQELYFGKVDRDFGKLTREATEAFQTKYDLGVDGKVGIETYGKAMLLGFSVLDDDDEEDDEYGPNWPSKPDFSPLNSAQRDKEFGHIDYVPNPTSGNPEGITITNNWAKENIVTVEAPQIAKIPGIRYQDELAGYGPKNGKTQVHKLAAEAFIKLWEAWEKENLLPLVKTWGGLWNPRGIRGYPHILSNHAYATAFDINVPWNMLKHQPALVGRTGSVRKLVPIAADLGWYWGGWFSRKDGMHFEFSKPEQTGVNDIYD
jgi:hypothetical protein